MKQAALWTLFWISLALLFNIGIWIFMGHEAAINFLSGYLLEKSLSIDNLFVFLMIFASFKISAPEQHKILRYGIWGAIIMRALMIFAGVALVQRFEWILMLFGVFLLFAAYKMAFSKEENQDMHDSKLNHFLQKHFRLSRFWQIVLLIEFSDILFATDSIPAIFAITQDPFIIFTSNLFAILGLRALYFVVADLLNRFHYLHYGLALILGLIGLKLMASAYIHVSPLMTLMTIVLILGASIIVSLRRSRVKGRC